MSSVHARYFVAHHFINPLNLDKNPRFDNEKTFLGFCISKHFSNLCVCSFPNSSHRVSITSSEVCCLNVPQGYLDAPCSIITSAVRDQGEPSPSAASFGRFRSLKCLK